MVSDAWIDGGIRYDYETFGALLPSDPDNNNTAIFAKMTLRNIGTKTEKARAATAFRQNGENRRERNIRFSKTWKYEIKANQLWRGTDAQKECAGTFTAPACWEAVSGIPYEIIFGKEYLITPRTEVAIARYEKELAPGETMELIIKFPRVPTADTSYLTELNAADYAGYRQKTVDYWKNALSRFSVIRTPGEPILAESHRATATHVMLATRCYNGKKCRLMAYRIPTSF